MTPPQLRVQLECELPDELAIGRGTALFVCGWCLAPRSAISSLAFVLDGERQPVSAHGMPRLDPLRALGEPDAYRSGFWGMVRIPAAGRTATAKGPGEELRLGLSARLEDGGEAAAEIARIRIRTGPQELAAQWPRDAAGPPVAICMATYNPPAGLLERQLESIRAQTHSNWVCAISDDCSSPERYAAIEAAIDGDPRFVVSRSPRRLGFYLNFERALSMAPARARFLAMADQDDVWHPEKLEALLGEIGSAQLVYSDARVVSGTGEVISPTWWSTRRNNHSDLLALLVANSVTGAASLLRAEVLKHALPFPPAQFAHFHDHWIGLVALALGDIAFVDRPLYDYVQHGAASLGHAGANRMTPLRERLSRQRAVRERVRLWRLHYFADACRLLQFATVLEMRCGPEMAAAKREELERFLRTERSWSSLARLGIRGARELVGDSLGGETETLGAEWMLFHAFGWRRLLALSARDQPQRRLRLDAIPPPSLIQEPGQTPLYEPARSMAEKIAPLRWALSDEAPRRINIMIPTIDLRHFFGGYIAKLNLARRLAERGERVRLVTVDPVGPLPGDWRRTVESYSGLEGLFDLVELELGRESSGIEVSRRDGFVASAWWTAHIAHDALTAVGGKRFVYLIQEYEPFTFPMGSYAALATESYRFPHFALFSSELLRDWFRDRRVGVYAGTLAEGDQASASFQNAITPVSAPLAGELAAREPRRLLFYARPEPHAARNLFELGVLALSRALEDGTFRAGWELHGIGTVERARTVALGGGAVLELLPRADQQGYAAALRGHDVGLALMYTPHPSLVPIEMAAAGMLTVTNSFDNKTAEAMSEISGNLITAEPTVQSLAAGLRAAARSVTDYEGRVGGSEVKWSRSWEESLDDRLVDRIRSALGVELGDVPDREMKQPGVRVSRAREQHPGLDVQRLAADHRLDDQLRP